MIRLGQRLRDARLQQGLTYEDVTKATKIRSSFLSAIEKGDYHKLPSSSYAQGFVVNYAQFLGFPRREALALFRREFDAAVAFKVLPDRFADPAERSLPRIKIRQTAIVISLCVFVFIGYVGYSYKDVFVNPALSVSDPQENSVQSGSITVSGKASPYASVTINNLPVTLDKNGQFTKKITFFPGSASIIVKAVNRFGKETTVIKRVMVK